MPVVICSCVAEVLEDEKNRACPFCGAPLPRSSTQLPNTTVQLPLLRRWIDCFHPSATPKGSRTLAIPSLSSCNNTPALRATKDCRNL
jgi:hypothetical protein